MQSIILILFSLFCLNAFAQTEAYTIAKNMRTVGALVEQNKATFECYGILTNETTKETKRVTLTQASYDKDFIEADLNNYGLGVDKWSLKSDGSLTIVVVEKKSGSSAASTAGWKAIQRNDGGTTLTNDLRFFFTLPDGSKEEMQINCYDYL